jgi:tripartite-type tricarboxylate transporter receptor subunit TctC
MRMLAALVALVLAAAPSFAQSYPSKPIRMVVPFAPAGPTDVIGRLVAQKLSEAWGQQVYVENLPGAGGNTGTANAARAPADGYTILVVSTGFIINPSLYAKVPYDPMKDFTPISLVAASPNVVTVHPSVPANTMQELIALIRANPGKYSYAQPALGSTPRFVGGVFWMRY